MTAERLLFCYGTLRDPEVRRQVFGRAVDAGPDVLEGFALDAIVVGGREHRILRPGGSERIGGLALRLTDADLAKADAYEPADYARIEVTLASGRRASVYVAADN